MVILVKPQKEYTKGTARFPLSSECLLETASNDNGMIMTLIAYRNNWDIDIVLETGEIITNLTYDDFRKGHVYASESLPLDQIPKTRRERVGMKVRSVVSNQMMEIIEYFSAKNITVRFETGDIYYKKSFTLFIRGKIGNPEYIKRSRLHEKKVNNNNEMMEIIRYGGRHDVDIQFEDGTIAPHKYYEAFKRGSIRHPFNPDECKRKNISEKQEKLLMDK